MTFARATPLTSTTIANATVNNTTTRFIYLYLLLWIGGYRFGPFARSASLTRDGSVRVVDIPGHMVGQVAVIVRGEDVTYLVAGDVSYKEQNLIEDKVDGVTMNVQTSLASQRAVKAFARMEPSVLLLGHDPGVPQRLANKQVLFGEEATLGAPPRSAGWSRKWGASGFGDFRRSHPLFCPFVRKR